MTEKDHIGGWWIVGRQQTQRTNLRKSVFVSNGSVVIIIYLDITSHMIVAFRSVYAIIVTIVGFGLWVASVWWIRRYLYGADWGRFNFLIENRFPRIIVGFIMMICTLLLISVGVSVIDSLMWPIHRFQSYLM
ncbi:hypothetical protein C444_06856 [Haloarcula japonica DSM 6131]|uniref:Uncharacterized protein n=1 Tax=Haloarcula japonica (strain ATCC 49778 / DSM 6131 / JCM 7785 / NBRC 101032 / NCIMB 13157 / TR-1) TaxID=1227453 RepID=M0LH27_HALJT|nr:hypothetical protein C444_06856 [Haloarcula japonica DSM 6131]